MPLEIGIFVISEDQLGEHWVETRTIEPGGFSHIPNKNFHDDSSEVYVVQCREDDELSSIHKLTHVVIDYNGHPPYVLFDRNKTENRPKLLKRGEERDLRIRQEVPSHGKTTLTYARFHLTHR